MEHRSVTIVGGGLAGMTAARELLKRGFSVTIYEAADRLGGKAGAVQHGTDYDEHGWHLFPSWYLNIWALVEELGIRSNFVDQSRYAYMRAGEYPRSVWLDSPFSFRTAYHNLFHGVLPPEMSYLYQFAILDLMSQPVRRRAALDQVTVDGFVRGKFYGIDGVVDGLQDTVSRASAIESFEMSSMTVRNVMRFWFRYHDPWFRVLNGNLQEKFIAPFEESIKSIGCTVKLNCNVMGLICRNQRIEAIEVRELSDLSSRRVEVDNLLLAIPAPNVPSLLGPNLLECAPHLADVYYLRSRIMAGMTIYFKTVIGGIPKEHINLVDTPYELSVIDVTKLWGREDGTVLCVVASDYTTLQGYLIQDAIPILLKELRRFLPFVLEENIRRIDLQPHVKQPLFANTAGAWPRRPTSTTGVLNLFCAGDYCQTHVDLTCMEGAVTSGLLAAASICRNSGMTAEVKVLVPSTRPRWLLVLLKWALLPGAFVALLVAKAKAVSNSVPASAS